MADDYHQFHFKVIFGTPRLMIDEQKNYRQKVHLINSFNIGHGASKMLLIEFSRQIFLFFVCVAQCVLFAYHSTRVSKMGCHSLLKTTNHCTVDYFAYFMRMQEIS